MSRARLNKNVRRKSALERRGFDVNKYEEKLKESITNGNMPTAVEFFTSKLSKAKSEVKSLEAKVIN